MKKSLKLANKPNPSWKWSFFLKQKPEIWMWARYKLKQFRKQKILLLVTAFIVIGAVRIGLWVMPFRTLVKLLKRVSKTPSYKIASELETDNLDTDKSVSSSLSFSGGFYRAERQFCKVRRIVWAINVASCYMPGKTKCLARALATQVLMNWHRYLCKLFIGVNKTPGDGFRAHAWIEYQGRVIIGNLTDLSQFTPLLTYRGFEP